MDLDAAIVGVLGVELLEERQRILGAGLEVLVGVQVALGIVAGGALLAQGLERAERLGLALDDHHSHGPERDVLAFRAGHLRDAEAGPEILVEALEARSGVYGIAERGV